MKPRIYVETSVISYLTARPSSNVMLLARQQFTRELWDLQPDRFEAWLSPLVLDEASLGDPQAAAARVQVCRGLPELEITTEVKAFAQLLVNTGAVPTTEPEDACTLHWLPCMPLTTLPLGTLRTWLARQQSSSCKTKSVNWDIDRPSLPRLKRFLRSLCYDTTSNTPDLASS